MPPTVAQSFAQAAALSAQPRHERYAAHIPVYRSDNSGRQSTTSIDSNNRYYNFFVQQNPQKILKIVVVKQKFFKRPIHQSGYVHTPTDILSVSQLDSPRLISAFVLQYSIKKKHTILLFFCSSHEL